MNLYVYNVGGKRLAVIEESIPASFSAIMKFARKHHADEYHNIPITMGSIVENVHGVIIDNKQHEVNKL